jgi:hypothetical protein
MEIDDVFHFTAVIYQIGQNRCVDVPVDVVADPSARSIPVVLTVAGRSKRTNLLSRGSGRFRVFVDSTMRDAAVADIGDPIEVDLRFDVADREPEVPSHLLAALEGAGQLQHVLGEMSVNQRREIVHYLDEAKRESTRAARITRIIEVLANRKRTDHDRRTG